MLLKVTNYDLITFLKCIIFTDVNLDSLAVFGEQFCHRGVEVGLVGVLLHVPDGVVVRFDLGDPVHPEPEGCEGDDD